MGFKIEDGVGQGFESKVDSKNRLYNLSDSRPIISSQSLDGLSYSFPTNIIALTSGTLQKGIFYLENNDTTKNLFVHRIQLSCSGGCIFRVVRNPTGISAAFSSGGVFSSNFSLNKTFAGSFAIGSDTGSFAGGDHFAQLFVKDMKDETISNGAILLGPGDSIGITANANVAVNVGVSTFGYLE